jgi:hypothetical protein
MTFMPLNDFRALPSDLVEALLSGSGEEIAVYRFMKLHDKVS